MQCFICVTYMMILCTAQPTKDHAIATTHEKRSLFRDVIESLRIRSQLPEEINLNDGNNLSQNYDRYGYDNDAPELPSDADFIPRRNDRIEMPTLKYRFPKSIQVNESEIKFENKKEDIIVYVSTPTERPEPKSTTQKIKKEPKPTNKLNFKNNNDMSGGITDVMDENYRPIINRMQDSSQIGDREYQTLIKPTVIVNFRGTVRHRDSEINLERRNYPKRKEEMDTARNVFNINQEIKLERPNGTVDIEGMRHFPKEGIQGINDISDKGKDNTKNNLLMCKNVEKAAQASGRDAREDDNIIQIIVTL